ncbi:tripartite tricarboxylate transporter substrate binding protein [Aquabacter sp. CN5-332]|uniref:Bug family tripartite tricarboxylate transporter substrate binding protein n=1 Tax=Aquabacter sp. CN5-332 TaxID=3156608 RepID=UPI0032B5E46B
MKIWNFLTVAALCQAAVLGMPASSSAQTSFPERAIKLIVSFPPGGGSDAVGRIIAQKLSENIQKPVVVDNRAGAATNIGLDAIAKAPPDGYTMGLATSNLAINPAVFPSLPFNPVTDFTPVTLAATGLYGLVVHPSVPANSVRELIAYAKANPGKIDAATAGIGTPPHLALAQLNNLAGTDIVPVAYKGAAPALVSVIAGETKLYFTVLSAALPHIKSGKLRLIALTTPERSSMVPDVPTMSEEGVKLEIYEWYGIVLPAKVPAQIVTYLNQEIVKVLKDESIKTRLTELGCEAVGSTPEAFGTFIRSEIKKMGEIARAANIKVE